MKRKIISQKKKVVSKVLSINGKKQRVRVHYEFRRDSTAVFRKNGINFHISYLLTPNEQQKTFDWLAEWLRRQVKKRPGLVTEFERRKYYDGKILRVGKSLFSIRIKYADRKTSIADFQDHTISLSLSNQLTIKEEQQHISSLVSRCVAEKRKPEIEARVKFFNKKYFNKRIKSVRLKNSSTTWGSCSVNGNLSFSTRLLFAPDRVINYIIIHELAHLVHMNHAPKFWELVKKIMPSYNKKEEWLKMNAHLCKF